jgi:hypothetical protein
MIVAKPVVPEQYWILRDHGTKVGNIEIDNGTYLVSINGRQRRFENLDVLANSIRIDFEKSNRTVAPTQDNQVHGYPTNGVAYNSIFDVQHQLPLWTQEPRSRSWLAAGWYRVKQHRNWQIMQCPKLILLQRYQYQGPFHTREEAESR